MSNTQGLLLIALAASAVLTVDWVLRQRRMAKDKARREHPSNGGRR